MNSIGPGTRPMYLPTQYSAKLGSQPRFAPRVISMRMDKDQFMRTKANEVTTHRENFQHLTNRNSDGAGYEFQSDSLLDSNGKLNIH